MKAALLTTALVTTASLLLGACADTTPGGQAVRARHEHFGELGAAFKAVNGELEAGTATSATVRINSDKIAALAPRVKTWFPAGSGPQDGKRTEAKAEVWTRAADFSAAATRLEGAAAALKIAADASDPVRIKATTQAVGAACKNCHQTFKTD